jgi:predicted amidohydrolase YtcJ
MQFKIVATVGLCGFHLALLVHVSEASHVAIADTILTNAKVITATNDDPARVTIAEAIAIHDGKIIAVGKSLEMQKYVTPATKQINIRGRIVIPGLIDTHNHLYETATGFPWAESLVPELREMTVRAASPKEAAASTRSAVERRAKALGPGKFIFIRINPADIALKTFGNTVAREALDAWAPENPVIVYTRGGAVLNTQTINAFQRFYGQEIPREYWVVDAATGWIFDYTDVPRCAKVDLVLNDKMDRYAEIFKSVLQVNAQTGVTTHLTHAQCLNGYKVGLRLDRAGEMPIRWGWGDGWGQMLNPRPEEYYLRLADTAGYGSDFLWSVGANPVALDGGALAMCTTIKDVPPAIKEREQCQEGHRVLRIRSLQAMVRAGLRVAGHHIAGDGALDVYLDAVEKYKVPPQRLVADHCHQVRPDQIERAKRLGVTFSCNAAIEEGRVVLRDYGEKYLSRLVPVRSMIAAGMKPVISEFGSQREVRSSPFEDGYAFMTRKSLGWVPFGVQSEALPDRMTMLLMMTRWAAPLTLRERVLGSIEPGKWADLVVLDRDPLTVSIEELPKVRPIMTMVAGKIVFEDPAFRGNTLRFNTETGQWERRIATE